MFIDTIDLSDLGNSAEEAFTTFEERLRKELLAAQHYDRDQNTEGSYYNGNYEPERMYVSSILAFLDEYDLELDIIDISEIDDNQKFNANFHKFFNKINYARTRFSLRSQKIADGSAGTVIEIKESFKEEIHKNINTIRKIVNQEIQDENKKDNIFKKLAALQSEIDRDRTTIDAVFKRFIDFSNVIGESAENIEPLVEKVERISKALTEGTITIKLISKKERPKIEGPSSTKKSDALEDEIPF